MEDGQPQVDEHRPRAGRRAAAVAAASANPNAYASAEEERERMHESEAAQPATQAQQQPPEESTQDWQQGDEDEQGMHPPPPAPSDSHEERPSRQSPPAPGGSEQQEPSSSQMPAPPQLPGGRHGRRANVGGFMAAPTASANEAEGSGGGAPPDPTRVPGEGPNKQLTGVSKRKQEQHQQAQEQKVKATHKYDERAMDAEVLDIPELEEEGKEDLSRQVAQAPKVRTNKVQGIMELDEDMQYMLPAAGDRDIDLSMLTAVLASSEQVEEKDDIWNHEALLTQLASELNSEMEKTEGMTKGVGDTAKA